MPSKPTPPTNGELEILRAMWSIGRARTLAIHKALNVDRVERSLSPLAFNTVATVLGKLHTKGFVKRHEDDPSRHEYSVIYSEDQISQAMAGDVVRRLFHGSVVEAVQSAFREKKPSREELAELQTLMDATATRGR
jgi:predicted transcriptional regulator